MLYKSIQLSVTIILLDLQIKYCYTRFMKKYCLIVRGKLVAKANSLEKAMLLRAYEPWNPSCQIYEFEYSPLTNAPIGAKLVS